MRPLRRAAYHSPFTPKTLRGLALWYDASRTGGFADGDAIAQWDDRSGNGRHASQATEASRPTYKVGVLASRAVVRFASDYFSISNLTTSGVSNYTFMIVTVLNATTDQHLIDTQTGRMAIGLNSTKYGWYDSNWQTTGTAATGAQLLIYTLNSAGGSVHQNGALLGSPAYTQRAFGGSTTLGTNVASPTTQMLNGDIAECALWFRVLSDGERAQLTRYAGQKYGLA